MRLRITALAVALAMLLPAAALAGGPTCASEFMAAADCCCGHEDEGDQATNRVATLERTCCCEIKRSPTHVPVPDARATVDHEPQTPEAATPAVSIAPRALVTSHARAFAHARGPPPARTLYAQRVALIC